MQVNVHVPSEMTGHAVGETDKNPRVPEQEQRSI
jgi:hypothetical protein